MKLLCWHERARNVRSSFEIRSASSLYRRSTVWVGHESIGIISQIARHTSSPLTRTQLMHRGMVRLKLGTPTPNQSKIRSRTKWRVFILQGLTWSRYWTPSSRDKTKQHKTKQDTINKTARRWGNSRMIARHSNDAIQQAQEAWPRQAWLIALNDGVTSARWWNSRQFWSVDGRNELAGIH